MLFAFEAVDHHVDLWTHKKIRQLCYIVEKQILPTLGAKNIGTVYTLGSIIGTI